LLDRETVVPPEGAAWLRVTVHVEGLPEASVVGLQASEDIATGDTREIEALCDAPFKVAVIAAV
jgi:hypothetical protein